LFLFLFLFLLFLFLLLLFDCRGVRKDMPKIRHPQD